MRARKRQVVIGLLGTVVLLLLCWQAHRTWTRLTGAKREVEAAPTVEIPCGPIVPYAAGDVRQLEDRVRVAAQAVLPAVVAVRNPGQQPPNPLRYNNYASGVIVTEDGIVLSQWHVSHHRRNHDRKDVAVAMGTAPTYLAGEKTTVILHDGRECPAELLGADRNRDLSLLRLVDPGPYPFVPLRPENAVIQGDWVLKVGHPLGYRPERSAPVRLGRVISRIDEIFSTDCGTTGGDSGGPFFNLDGQLVGIIGTSYVGAGRAVAADDPLLTLRADSRLLTTATGARFVHDVFERMLAGKIMPSVGEDLPTLANRLANAEHLRAEDWTQGRATRDLFRSFVATARSSVVVVLNHGVAVGLGTVVAADCVITKASELPSVPTCRLSDGRTVSARVLGVEPAFDLALLKVQATGLKPIEWGEDLDPPVGSMLAAAGPGELPLAVGVLSAPRYEIANPRAPTYSLPLHVAAYEPAVFGTSQGNGVYSVVQACGLAWSAGIRPGDVLREVAGHKIRTDDDISVAVNGRWSGEVVPVVIERDGKTIGRRLPLGPKPLSLSLHAQSANYRSDDFPILYECAVPFLSFECGGPIVDRSGRAIGISIARVCTHGGMGIPADCIQRLLADLESGKLAQNWNGE